MISIPKLNQHIFIWALGIFTASLFKVQPASAQMAQEAIGIPPRVVPVPDSMKIRQVALAFIDAIADNYNIRKLSGICTVPFAFDKDVLITDTDSLWQYFHKLAAHGKHKTFTVVETKTEIVRIWQEIAANVVPVSVAIVKCRCRIKISDHEETNTVTLAISLASTPKIAGISD